MSTEGVPKINAREKTSVNNPAERSVNTERLIELIDPEDGVDLTKVVEELRKEISSLPSVGATLDIQQGSQRREFVIPLVSLEQKERVLGLLSDLSINPWEENQLLIIDNRGDLKKLAAAGLTEYIEGDEVQPILPATETIEHITFDEYPFPMQESLDSNIFPPKSQRSSHRTEEFLKSNEEMEADKELAELISKFDQGYIEDDDPALLKQVGVIPTLTVFPRKYIWKNGVLLYARTGDEISAETLKDWHEEARAGNEQKIEELVRIHSGHVLGRVALAKKRAPNADADDLFQEGIIGLSKAVQKYDVDRESSFLNYATYWIDAKILRYIQNHIRTVRRPIHAGAAASKYFKAERQFNGEGAMLTTKKEEDEYYTKAGESLASKGINIRVENGLDLDRLRRTLLINHRFNPLDESFGEENHSSDVDMLANPLMVESEGIEETVNEQQLRKILAKFLLLLPPKQERVLRMRFGFNNVNGQYSRDKEAEGMTLEEIGQELGVGRERVRQIEAKALRKLGHPAYLKKLRSLLD